MIRGIKITYNKNRKRQPWKMEMIGNKNMVSNFYLGSDGVLKCAHCLAVHWHERRKDEMSL